MLATFFFVVEIVLVSLTWLDPGDAIGLIPAGLLVLALLGNFVAGVVGARVAEADRRREAEQLAGNLSVLATQQAALRRVATLVAQGVSQAELFSAVGDEMARCLQVANTAMLRYEDDGSLTLLASHTELGVPEATRVGDRLTRDREFAGTIFRTGRPARIDSPDDAVGPIGAGMRKRGVDTAVGAPIVVDDRVWGAAVVASAGDAPLPPDTEDRIAEFANLVATAIAASTTRAELIASRARIVAAADDARRRFERDLHDGAQQRLVALGLKVHLAQDRVPAEMVEVKNELSETVAGLTAVAAELQEISRGIHPAILSRGGLGAALKTLARRCTVPVTLHTAIDRRLPEQIEVAAYYVVAEALTNAAKHAHASGVSVRAEATGELLQLSIRDDGVGGADSTKGSGLIGLKDRVEVVGGRIQVSSPPGSGTALDIAIPLARPPASVPVSLS